MSTRTFTIACAVLVVAAMSRLAAQQPTGSYAPIASVLSSPRCANCHIPGDAPVQGNDGHLHRMNVVRGEDGRGAPAMRCTTCHQDESGTIPHAPPGAPDWRLPARSAPMPWGRATPAEQCRLLKDPARNGGRDATALLEHVEHDPLVLASWQSGPGREPPPLAHDKFVAAFRQWVNAGAVCPE